MVGNYIFCEGYVLYELISLNKLKIDCNSYIFETDHIYFGIVFKVAV